MIGSLFSGIGGLEMGLELAGFGPVAWQCEADAFCRSVLRAHWNCPIYPDIKELRDVSADVICGGFPCQDLSTAGRKAGFDGARSGLWFEMLRVIREARPRAVVVENVWNAKKTWVPVVRGGLADLGYRTSPVLRVRACDVGARHERSRGFVLALADSVLSDGDRGNQARCAATWARPADGTATDPDGIGDGRIPTPQGRANHEGAARAAADASSERWGTMRGGRGSASHEPAPRFADWLDSAIRTATDAHVGRLESGDGAGDRECRAGDEAAPWSGASPFDPLVRGVHGIPDWMDGSVKPSGWTPARVHAAKICALGNAVVPPVAHAVGLVLKQWIEWEHAR
ncbi:MAG: DNA cytosine methyltransferase [Thermoleophilia bacterium]